MCPVVISSQPKTERDILRSMSRQAESINQNKNKNDTSLAKKSINSADLLTVKHCFPKQNCTFWFDHLKHTPKAFKEHLFVFIIHRVYYTLLIQGVPFI